MLDGRTFSMLPREQTVVYPWRAWAPRHPALPQTDQAELNHPWNEFIRRSVRGGELPWWNPFSFAGQPFAANGSSGVFYPPRLIPVLAVSPDRAHDLFCLFHVFASGLCMWLFARSLGQGNAGAALAGVAWMFAAFNMAWLQLETVTPISVFLPLGLFAARQAMAVRRTFGWALVAAAVSAVFLVSGHLAFMGVTYAAVCAYAGALAAHDALRRDAGRGERLAAAARLAAIVAGPLLLAAPVLLPTAHAIAASHRRLFGYAESQAWWLPAGALWRILAPPPLPLTEARMHEMAFVGRVTAVLAVAGLAVRGRGRALAIGLIGVVVPVILGGAPLRIAMAMAPPIAVLRPFGRYLFLISFAVAILGGAGLDALARVLARRATRVAVAAAVLAVGWTSFELVRYGRAINPRPVSRRPQLLLPETHLIRALADEQRVRGGRIVPLDSDHDGPILLGALPMAFGVASLGGYDSVAPARAVDLARLAGEAGPDGPPVEPDPGTAVTRFRVSRLRTELLPRLDSTILVAPPDIEKDPDWAGIRRPSAARVIYSGRNGHAYVLGDDRRGPYVVHALTVVNGEQDALKTFADPRFDPRASAVAERPDLPAGDPSRWSGSVRPALVRALERRNNALRFTVDSDRPGWLVIPETWDRGWRARVNDRPARVLRANYAHRAVAIPAGESDVRLEYRPPGLVAGLLAAAAFIVVAAGGLAAGRRSASASPRGR